MLTFCKESTKEKGNFLNREQFFFLQKLVLVRIITFNARRGGEAAKPKMEQMENLSNSKRQVDVDSLEDPLVTLGADIFQRKKNKMCSNYLPSRSARCY